MKRTGRLLLLAPLLLSALSPAARAAEEIVPVVRAGAQAGQVFFKSAQGVSGGLAGAGALSGDWLIGGGLKLSDRDSLIGTLSGQYLRRDQVDQIGGGGTLVSQTLDDGAALRWVRSLGDWVLKPSLDFKNELVSSLPQDRLGKGFYDQNQVGADVELEWKGGRLRSLRQTLSLGRTTYYRYSAAASPLFGAELHSDDGNLDFTSLGYTAAADYEPWPSGLVSGSAGLTYSSYGRQGLVLGVAGNPAAFAASADTRKDWQASAVLGLTQSREESWRGRDFQLSAGLTGAYTRLSSNQNNFDGFQSSAGTAQFNPDFYSYHEFAVGPLLSAASGPWRGSLAYAYTRRGYAGRPVQDASGNYLGGQVTTTIHSLTAALSYSLGRGISLDGSAGYFHSASNTQFEAFYLYNYSYPFYFAGLSCAL